MNPSTPEARALTESAVLDLFGALEFASCPEKFLASADAIVIKPKNHLALPVSRGIPDDLTVEGNRGVDVDNAPRLHEYIGEMDRANASDARLWNYLSFATYRAYMEKRWPLTQNDSADEAWKGRVKDRWLLHTGAVTRGRLVRHGIARLWWVTHLTYFSHSNIGITKDDPYAYTREVFKSEDRINALFDREVGAIPSVMAAVLDHATYLGTKATDKYLQRIMQYLKLINGYREIGILDEASIAALVNAAAKRASQHQSSA